MNRIVFLIIVYVFVNATYAQEVQVEVQKLSKYSSTTWSIMDEFGQKIISSPDFEEPEFITYLEPNTKFYFNINIDQISKNDTSLYFLKLNNEPIILINTDLEIGDHSYMFYTEYGAPELRIVGGSDASIEDYPWQIYLTAGDYMCGGTIISENWILTAAHCAIDDAGDVYSTSKMSVKVGATNPYRSWLGKVYSVKNVIVHQNYNINDLEYDIAILELSEPIDFENAEPIKLITAEDVVEGKTAPGVMATVTGWGLTNVSPDLFATTLQEVKLPIVSNETAAVVWGKIDPSILMAGYLNGGKDACSGDSGGPLIVDVDGEPKLAGIVSWGSENCDTYGGFTRVSDYLDWIYDNSGIPRPIVLNAPVGTSAICDKAMEYNYATDDVNASFYEWSLIPSNAGSISYDGKESTITWSDDYYGIAQIKVRAEVENDLTSWATANVEILELTNVYYQEGDTTICNNTDATFFVSASGDNLSYNWYQNGELYVTTNNGYLELTNADTTNTGTYYCSVEGTCGTKESGDIQLLVHPTTEVNNTPGDKELIQNTDATLDVLTNGHNLTYQWYKNNEPITEGGNMSYLELPSVNATDIGQYWLEVNGTCGSDISGTIYVYVDLNKTTNVSAKVWPNLSNNVINTATSNALLHSIYIYNSNGQIIYEKDKATAITTIDVSSWADGLYIVKIISDGLDSTFKVIKY